MRIAGPRGIRLSVLRPVSSPIKFQSMSSSSSAAKSPPPQISCSAGEDFAQVTRETTPLITSETGGRWQLTDDGKGLERGFRFKTFRATWVSRRAFVFHYLIPSLRHPRILLLPCMPACKSAARMFAPRPRHFFLVRCNPSCAPYRARFHLASKPPTATTISGEKFSARDGTLTSTSPSSTVRAFAYNIYLTYAVRLLRRKKTNLPRHRHHHYCRQQATA